MNYYNEFDANAAAWLRELIAAKLIPEGDVDERSIADVAADDLRGYTQCHFFAGIGGWSLALRLAGWPDEKPCWTGSCPCQSFSTAGKQRGFDDERDLWPVFAELIRQCRPEYVFGEQVENAIKHGWLDRVYADLEGEGYAVGAVVLGAHSIGSPHRRQRLYWGGMAVADGHSELCEWNRESGESRRDEFANCCGNFGLAEDANGRRCGGRDHGDSAWFCWEIQTKGLVNDVCLSDATSERRGETRSAGAKSKERVACGSTSGFSPWLDCRLIYCRDNKIRRVPAESLLFGVADGVPGGVDGDGAVGISETGGFPLTTKKEGRAMLLKGYGNAIVPQAAAEFIMAFKQGGIER